jgi:hypothetical protein
MIKPKQVDDGVFSFIQLLISYLQDCLFNINKVYLTKIHDNF